MEYVIRVEGLSKKYANFALENVSFALPSGCIMGLVGKNGAGKSTTIRSVIGGMRIDSGTVTVLGHNTADKDFYRCREDIGIVFDELFMSPCYRAKMVDKYMAAVYKNWDSKKFFGLLKQFDVPQTTKVKDLSRGNKMKLSIAIALSHKPKLLVLDEPTSGLDPVVRDEILDVFNEFTRNEECSVLISSHIVSDLEKICDYITFLDNGHCFISEEKDRLLETYGLISCDQKMLDELDSTAVLGMKKTPYGINALVERTKIPKGFTVERATLEDIFLYMTRKPQFMD